MIINRQKSKSLVQKTPARARHSRGQSLVEFAISCSILMLAFSGIVDIGRASNIQHALDDSTDEGSLWISNFPNCVATANEVGTSGPCSGTNSVWGRVLESTTNLDPKRIGQVKLTDDGAGGGTITAPKAGDILTLTVTYNLNMLTPIMQTMFGPTMTLQAIAKELVRRDVGTPLYEGSAMGPQITAVSCTKTGGKAPYTATFTWTAPVTLTNVTGYALVNYNDYALVATVNGSGTTTLTTNEYDPTQTYYVIPLTNGLTIGYAQFVSTC